MRAVVNIVVFVFAFFVVAIVTVFLGAIGPLELLLMVLIAVAVTWWLDRRGQTGDTA